MGLNLAVATMRKGEQCSLKVRPEYGYGDRGDHFPFQHGSAAEPCSYVSLGALTSIPFTPFFNGANSDFKIGNAMLRHCMRFDICAGSFSFPAVPPRAELEYELELLDFDPADEVGCHAVCNALQQANHC